jgi:hypothetical protein
MKLLKSTLNIEEHLSSLENLLLFDKDSILILDTNILIWLYRVNKEARFELFNWMSDLKHDKKIIIPSWSIHEYNIHLQQQNDAVFFPLTKVNKTIRANLNELDNYANLITNHDLLKDSGFLSRSELLIDLEKSTQKISEILNCLSKVKKTNSSVVRDEIENFIEGIIMDSDIYSIQEKVESKSELRYDNRIPPGFKDKTKDNNNIGDLIIWNEVIEYCKKNNYENALFLTLDNKTDWISYPKKITKNKTTKTISYDHKTHSNYFFTNPSLSYEFSKTVGESGKFEVININLLTEILANYHSDEYDGNYFRQLSQAVKHIWNMSETEKLSIWIGERKDLIVEATNGVCYWKSCPSEINEIDFKEWLIEKECPKFNYDEIKLGKIIADHFI